MNKKYLWLSRCAVWLVLFLAAPVISQAETYSYDVTGRLTKVTNDDGSGITYTYDNAGNLLQRAISVNIDSDGDIDRDGNINLSDAILALQVLAGMEPSSPVYKDADVNNDGKIGLQEAIYILQEVSGLRP